MTVTYSFPNLAALADHFASRAAERRKDAAWVEQKAQRGWRAQANGLKSEAMAYEDVSHTLRNLRLEEPRSR